MSKMAPALLWEGTVAKKVYLDYNATTPVAPEVLDAMSSWFTERFWNAAARHTPWVWSPTMQLKQPVGSSLALLELTQTRSRSGRLPVVSGGICSGRSAGCSLCPVRNGQSTTMSSTSGRLTPNRVCFGMELKGGRMESPIVGVSESVSRPVALTG